MRKEVSDGWSQTNELALFKDVSVGSTDRGGDGRKRRRRRTSVGLVVNKKPHQTMTIMSHLHTVNRLSPSSLSLLQPLSRLVSLFFPRTVYSPRIYIKL